VIWIFYLYHSMIVWLSGRQSIDRLSDRRADALHMMTMVKLFTLVSVTRLYNLVLMKAGKTAGTIDVIVLQLLLVLSGTNAHQLSTANSTTHQSITSELNKWPVHHQWHLSKKFLKRALPVIRPIGLNFFTTMLCDLIIIIIIIIILQCQS